MNDCRMVEFCPCRVIGIIISAILGIAAGALFFSGVITVLPVVSWFFIISAAIVLALLIISVLAFCIGMCDNIIACFCSNLGILIAGIVGTIVLGVFTLVFPLAATSIFSVIVLALLVFFFGLVITGIVCFLLCVCERECPDCNGATGGAGNNNCCCCCCYPCNSCECNNNSNSNSNNNCNTNNNSECYNSIR